MLLSSIMPPRIRTRASKALKENINVTGNKLKTTKSNTKASRKALADKTNSASDDASFEILKPREIIIKSSKVATKQTGVKKQNIAKKQNSVDKINTKSNQKSVAKENAESVNDLRPRRERRLPTRFVENHILINLANSKDSVNTTHNSSITKSNNVDNPGKNESLSKSDKPEASPFKTPVKTDSSLLASRPRRICRLPSRFEDHSISPKKYIPIQPANASTPIPQSKTKTLDLPNDNIGKVGKDLGNIKVSQVRLTRLAKIDALLKESSDNSSDKSSPDSNNNAKGRSTRVKKPVKNLHAVNTNQSPIRKFFTSISRTHSPFMKTQSQSISQTQSPVKKTSPKQTTSSRKIIDKNLSIKVLGGNKMSQESDGNDRDVYEFTFDPKEEPQPQKKKRKKPVTKKPSNPKPKRIAFKSSYDQNISKALAALKTAVKPSKAVEAGKLTQITENDEVEEIVQEINVTRNINKLQNNNVIKENIVLNDTDKNSVHEGNYPSIRVEDIAADIEPSLEHHDYINYSPVNSPRPNESMTHNLRESPEKSIHNNDPLNLQEELSFFDDQPVASSSMNMSNRHPLASPWRVEFGSLPIKWPVNTYMKANMTPAVESSFICAEDSSKKKHVYTNMLPQPNDTLPEIVDNAPSFKQTSILSFIQEMAEKSAKKKRGRSASPMKAIYEEIIDKNVKTSKSKKSTKKPKENEVVTAENTFEEVSGISNNTSNEKEHSKEEKRSRKRKNNENLCDRPAKSPRKQKDTNCTYFGFDESENEDNQEQENVSPIKINNKPKRFLRPRSKVVLQEINGPIRASLPVAAKTKLASSSDTVNRVYEELKSAAVAPLFPEKNVNDNVDNATNIEDLSSNEDSQSVHLFEDIEVVHHLKPSRKSYGKAKKVTYRQQSTSDSDTRGVEAERNDSSDYDDLGDLTFEIPKVQEKKTTKKKKPKKLRSKKEEQEAEAWAANFNSMCEDVEEFPLLVE